MLLSVLKEFGLEDHSFRLESFGSGLIHHTWKVRVGDKDFILQRINHTIFKDPWLIAENISLVAEYLQANHPDYRFISPLLSSKGEKMVYRQGAGYFRLFPFVQESHTIDVVSNPMEAYEAAAQFGRFTKLLSGLDPERLKFTIPSFHDLGLRYERFQQNLANGNRQRIIEAGSLVKKIVSYSDIVSEYNGIKSDPSFKIRVTHHDTKISNVLFDQVGRGICVVDLDTVMPGYFISDLGDMMRTYLSPVNEESRDFDRISVREGIYEAIVNGYMSEMKEELSPKELRYILFAGKFMIYMQALRFMDDHITNDLYYGAHYSGHNYDRAKNQWLLLERFLEMESKFNKS